jgi:[acyl-carrier-protein] S-malonyltransferase
VFLFPGQGTLPDALPEGDAAEALLDRAEDRGVPLRALMTVGDMEALRRTEHAQPLIFIDSTVKAASLAAAGRTPAVVAGHSLGEYAALVCADVLEAEDALDLVIERGRAMAPVPGSMAAIVKLTVEQVEALCGEVPDVVVANINGERQIVVSGAEDAVRAVSTAAERIGGRVFPLAVSGPFHSPRMAEAAERFAPHLDHTEFRRARIPVVSAVTGAVERDPDRLRRLMRGQILACVRWLDAMRTVADQSVRAAVEVGPGAVLQGLGRRIVEGMEFRSYEEALRGGV